MFDTIGTWVGDKVKAMMPYVVSAVIGGTGTLGGYLYYFSN